MRTTVSSSSAAYGSGDHWDDNDAHAGRGDHYDNDNSSAAATASENLRDFTWYSAMLLSHLFALEHAQLVRVAAAEEARRRSATAVQSPQLLMRAAVAAVTAPATTAATTKSFLSATLTGERKDVPTAASKVGDGEKNSSPVTAAGAKEILKLPHLATQHRPHILLGLTVHGGTAINNNEGLWNDPATRWRVSLATAEAADAGATKAADNASSVPPTLSTAALFAVFDAFYFPSELFPSLDSGVGASSAVDSSIINNGGNTAGRSAEMSVVSEDAEFDNLCRGDAEQGGMRAVNATAAEVNPVATAGGMDDYGGDRAATAGGQAGAPRVTPEALREAFHTLLLLGQRCATFALTFNGIIGGSGVAGADDAATATGAGREDTHATTHTMDNFCFSSEDEMRSGGGGQMMMTGSAAMQQTASASLQFMLQLACSCPCAPLSYAAQLCLAHALAVQPTPRTLAGWTARQQLLRFLPVLHPPSRALAAEGAGASHLYSGISASATAAAGGAVGGSAALGIGVSGLTGNTPAAGGVSSNRVPATQYVRAEDPILWFDAAGMVHLTTAQRWWEKQQQQHQHSRDPLISIYCGPLPATTALPTVQRLLMEEDQYMGPNGSAAAALRSALEAVATEVTLNARIIPGRSSSSLVHTRRRRGLHSSSSSISAAGLNGSPRSAMPGALHAASPNPFETSLDVERSDSLRGGTQSLPQPSPGRCNNNSSCNSGTPSSAVTRTQGTAAAASSPSSSRLSKVAKRRRALLFALAQSHLLPPTLQLTTSKTLLYGVFTDGGECPSYYMLLSLYPDVLRAHHASLHYVLFEDGPLAIDVRLMVATMAASRHRCEYLVSRFSALLLRYAEEAMLEDGHEDEMMLEGNGTDYYDSVYRSSGSCGRYGPHSPLYDPHNFDTDDEAAGGGGSGYHGIRRLQQQQQQPPCRGHARQRWIMHGPPARLRAVQRFIAIAAHTPWTLNEHDIRSMLADGWTIPEVFQLAAIVAQVVPLCSFVMGMFVPAEPWTMTLLPLEVVERLGHRAVTEETSVGNIAGTGGGAAGGGGPTSSGSGGTLSGLRRISNVPGDSMSGNCPGPATPHLTASSRSLLGVALSGNDVTNISGSSNNINSTSNGDVYRRYAGEDNIVSEQRIKGSNTTTNPHTLWRSQFTWNEIGATSMEQYYPGAATLMSEEIECFFDVVRELTKADCVGLMSPDYAPSYAFRSLQLYVQNLLGFMVEDYPYNDINKVLRRPAKWFAQVLTMRPETLTRSEVVRWYVPTTPPIGKSSSDLSAESLLVTHQLKREIELLSVVDSAQGGHRGGIESASAHPDVVDNPPPTPAEAAREAMEAEALQTALALQDERVLLLIALATMEARKEGLLHILLRPICTVLSNM